MPDQQRSKLTRRRKLLYSAATLAFTLLLITFALRELEKNDLIVSVRKDDRVAHPVPHPQGGLPAQEIKASFRLVLIGDSFIMGDPYVNNNSQDSREHTLGYGGIPDWLGAILEMRYPSVRFKVVNNGAPGANAVGVRDLVAGFVKTSPDLLIVSAGNNEGYVAATPFNELLQKWIVYRVLKKELLREPRPEERYMFPPQDPDAGKIERQFREQIDAIITLCRDNRAPLALATLPINLKYTGPNPWFVGATIPYPKDDLFIARGRKLQKQKKYQEAIGQFAQSANQAYAVRFMAECFEALGQNDLARQLYKIHVEQNPMGRARPSFNAYVRDAAAANKTRLLDLENAMDQISPHGISGEQYFWDNCHLTWEGYFLMAREIADELIAAGVIAGAADEPRPTPTREEIIARYHWEALNSFQPRKWWDFMPPEKGANAQMTHGPAQGIK